MNFLLKEFFYLLTGSKRTTFSQNINNFTMMPSYSSADLRFPGPTDNSGKNLYKNWSQEYLCGKTPFDYIYAPKDVNEQHVLVSQQGSEWFESEVKCARADLPVFFNPVINGNSTFCTLQNYSVSFCQPGNHSIAWQVSNPNLATISGGGDQITLTRKASGTLILTATISYPCIINGLALKTILTNQITIGSPQPGPITFPLIDYRKIQAQIDPVPGATSYNWYKNRVAVTGLQMHSAFVQTPIPQQPCDIEYDISVEAVNACGASLHSHANAYVPCDNYFIISPNPASTLVTISTLGNKGFSPSTISITDIKIYDQLGNLKKYEAFNKVKTATMSISSLQKGTYFIEISSGMVKEKKQLIILK